MNVYDFDQTIFYPDSSFCFTKWYLSRHPILILRWFPEVAVFGLLYFFKLVSKERFKEALFCYIPHVKDIVSELETFWDANTWRFSEWYLRQKRPDDIIVSASPDFVIRPIADKLGFELIASDLDKMTGKMHGLNCSGKEKVRRFLEAHPGTRPLNFYSDSRKDTPMAEFAENAYMVKNKGKTPVPWEFK